VFWVLREDSAATPNWRFLLGHSSTYDFHSGGTTGSYVPAAGTDPSGAIFQTYTNPKLGYQMLYPGGWNVTTKDGIVRIAKLGNSIVIATRNSKDAPKVKPVRAALINQQKKKTVLDIESRPKSTKLNGDPAIKMVFTKDQPATDFIMGHESPHMSSQYRERISDERLLEIDAY
jgi:hypothetical protein